MVGDDRGSLLVEFQAQYSGLFGEVVLLRDEGLGASSLHDSRERRHMYHYTQLAECIHSCSLYSMVYSVSVLVAYVYMWITFFLAAL